jgi:hypothetical protein
VREEIFVVDPPVDAHTTGQLREAIQSGNVAERARAMGAVARRAAREAALLDEVIALLSDPMLRQLRYMGTVSIAHIGVACLAIAGSQEVRERLARLLSGWPEPDRNDLVWFLKSQEIQLEAPATSA